MKNRIGIVGGGQLGRMLGFAAKQMGFTVTVMDPTPHSPAGQVVDEQIIAGYKDEKGIRQLATHEDFLTFESEFTNAEVLQELSETGVKINPSAKTLTIIKDKLTQKKFLQHANISVADFTEIKGTYDIAKTIKEFGYPFLLKKRFDAYDGKGNALIKKQSDIAPAIRKLGEENLYIERFFPFVKELAIMVARNHKGEIMTYPVVQTIHKNNICHIVMAPAPVSLTVQRKATRLAKKVMQNLHGAGVFGIEMFLDKKGNVAVNEIAPRVHNSGHYTIEACYTSQFEQHIRAIADMPLGNTNMKVPASVMINILGERNGKVEIKGLEKVLKIPNVSVHIYGKTETRMERKMGHITVVGNSLEECLQKAKKARKMISI